MFIVPSLLKNLLKLLLGLKRKEIFQVFTIRKHFQLNY